MRAESRCDPSNSVSYELKEAPIGGAGTDAVGDALPPETLELARASDAILLGGAGVVEDENRLPSEGAGNGLLRLRKALTLFANYRPMFLFPELEEASSLKRSVVSGVADSHAGGTQRRPLFRRAAGDRDKRRGRARGRQHDVLFRVRDRTHHPCRVSRGASKTPQGLLRRQIECARDDGAVARSRDARRKVLIRTSS